jgi:hypothetical protein
MFNRRWLIAFWLMTEYGADQTERMLEVGRRYKALSDEDMAMYRQKAADTPRLTFHNCSIETKKKFVTEQRDKISAIVSDNY